MVAISGFKDGGFLKFSELDPASVLKNLKLKEFCLRYIVTAH